MPIVTLQHPSAVLSKVFKGLFKHTWRHYDVFPCGALPGSLEAYKYVHVCEYLSRRRRANYIWIVPT